jgi:sec-independent protein translocase protein TatB
MFEIAWSELFIIVIVAIIVVGPKELPGMLRALGRVVGKLRRSADEFRRQFEDSMREAGGEDLQRELNELRRNNPLNEIRNTIESAAREASDPPKLPAPATSPDKPEEPPIVHETLAEPEAKPAVPAPASPADAAPATPPAAPAAAPEAKSAPASEPAVSPGHEPLINGQHRPLS